VRGQLGQLVPQHDVDPLLDQDQSIEISDPDNYVRSTWTGAWQCLLCFHQASTRNFAKKHVKTHRCCDRCGRNWAGKGTIFRLRSHQKTCRGRKQTICQFCGTQTKDPSSLRQHLSYCRFKQRIVAKLEIVGGRVSIYSSYFFIRIVNNFGLLFEYLNNIRIFILINKLPILAQNFKKIQKKPFFFKSKLRRNNRISCFRADLHSKGSTNYKI
jgi:hypothetical protein